MPNYYVNKRQQLNGDHEVHTTGCPHMAASEDRLQLGNHATCQAAVEAAKRHYKQVSGCYHCANTSHTSKDKLVAAE